MKRLLILLCAFALVACVCSDETVEISASEVNASFDHDDCQSAVLGLIFVNGDDRAMSRCD